MVFVSGPYSQPDEPRLNNIYSRENKFTNWLNSYSNSFLRNCQFSATQQFTVIFETEGPIMLFKTARRWSLPLGTFIQSALTISFSKGQFSPYLPLYNNT